MTLGLVMSRLSLPVLSMSIHVMIPAVFQLSRESRPAAAHERRIYLMHSEFTSATYLQSATSRDQPGT